MATEAGVDILLTQRFLPEHGGSIRWMYEVYRRWPNPVQVITHDYYNHPPRTPEFPDVPERPDGGDHVTDANLSLDRRDIFLHDWGLQSAGNWLRYRRMTAAVRQHLGTAKRVRVHCTHVLPEVLSLVGLGRRCRRHLRTICYAHGEEITACRSSRQLHFLMRRAYRHVDLLLANSQYTAELAQMYVCAEKIHVVHPGVENAEFKNALEAGEKWRRASGYEGRLVVLTMGRLDPRKNHASVINAVGDLVEKYPNLLYVIAGEGRHQPVLRGLSSQRGVEDNVVFVGAVDGQLRLALFGGCDVFAMPAIQDGTDVEGFGIVFLEAGSCAKPVIAGQSGGQADAVLNGRTGMVVDGTDQSAVTAALDGLLGDEALRRRLGQQGRQRAAEHDWAAVIQRTIELVEELR